MLFLLVTSVVALAFETRTAKASGTVYINADGSIAPSTAPISTVDNITYTLAGNINESIVVQRSNIVVDGAGYTVQGSGSGNGIDLESVNNVTVENASINDFQSGIWLNASFNDTLSNNTLTWNGPYGIYLNASSNNTLSGNYASGSAFAVYLYNSSNNVLSGNIVISNHKGISLDSSNNNTLNNNYVTENPAYGIELFSSSYNLLVGNTVLGNAGLGGVGVYLSFSPHNTLSGNNATANYDGIVLDSSSGNILFQNVIGSSIRSNFGVYGSTLSDYINSIDTSNLADGKPIYYIVNQYGVLIDPVTHPNVGYLALVNCSSITVENLTLANIDKEGLLLAYATNCTITRNDIVNNRHGIYLFSSSNNTLSTNNVTAATQYTYWGIFLDSSYNNTVSRNNVTGNGEGGIHLEFSSGNTVSDNRVVENPGGIGLSFSSSNNTLSGNLVFGSTSWGIWLLESSSNMVSGNTLTKNNFVGIGTTSSFGNTLIGNNASGNYDDGIYVSDDCFNETVADNNASGNHADGIGVSNCNNITVSGNNVTENGENGIALYSSSGSTVSSNNAMRNGYGFYLATSSNNTIYHNNIINNTQQAVLSGSEPNAWDDGYPSGGNFWSNYTGSDSHSSPYQNETGSDGIGDTTYVIDAKNTDRYPLMGPITSFDVGTWNRTASSIDIVSNSTVLSLEVDVANRTVSFNVTGPESTYGFCRLTLPNILVQTLWHGNFTVRIDNELVPFTNWTDASNTYVYVNYTHSEHEVMIIPEFPLTATAWLFTVLSMVAVVLAERRTHRKSKTRLDVQVLHAGSRLPLNEPGQVDVSPHHP